MKTRIRTVDDNLIRVDLRWRWLRLLQHTGTFGVILALFFVLLAWPCTVGWLTDPSLAKALVGLACVLGLVCWCGLALAIFGKNLASRLAGPRRRARSAQAARPRQHSRSPGKDPRVSRGGAVLSAHRPAGPGILLSREPPASTISARRPLLHLLVLFLAVLGTLRLYDKLPPGNGCMPGPKNKRRPSAPTPTRVHARTASPRQHRGTEENLGRSAYHRPGPRLGGHQSGRCADANRGRCQRTAPNHRLDQRHQWH